VIFKILPPERQRTKEGMNRSVNMGKSNPVLFLFLNIFLGVLAVQNHKG
jgi:hypothetical protein